MNYKIIYQTIKVKLILRSNIANNNYIKIIHV